MCVLESVVLYRLTFLKIILPKGKFPKQGICSNCSFSLVQHLQRKCTTSRLSHIVKNRDHNPLFSTLYCAEISEEPPFFFMAIMYLFHLLCYFINSLILGIESLTIFSCPMILSMVALICGMILKYHNYCFGWCSISM